MKSTIMESAAFFLLVLFCCSIAQILPADRRIDWSQSGIPGGIPGRTAISATIDATLYGKDVADATGAIQTALDACPADQAVYIPEGRYLIKGNLRVPSNVSLRGAGPRKTVLDARGAGNGLILFHPYVELWKPPLIPITGGLDKGSTAITVGSADAIAVGSHLVTSLLNDTSYVTITGVGGDCTWCDEGFNGARAMGQIVEVIAKNGVTITIKPGLYFTYASSLSPTVSVIPAGARYAGVEDLQVSMNNSGYTANFLMGGAAYCWIKNVESDYTDGDHARVFLSYRCEIRDSYFHDAYSHLPGQTDADIFIASKSSGILVENNILRRLHASIMLNWGASGNVIGYNFCEGDFDSRVPNCLFADLSMHGAHPMFNLWEGNVAGALNPDSYWGSSSHNTGFRNWLKGTTKICKPITGRGAEQKDSCWWAVQNMRAVALDFACRYYNLLGNIAGSDDCVNLTYYNNGVKKIPAFAQCLAPRQRSYDGESYGLSFGYASSGDDGSSASANPRVYATTIIHGNVTIADTAITWDSTIADRTLPPSLYLTGKPAWFGGVPWPPLGPDVAGFTNKIPAQLRFEGGLKVVDGKSPRPPDPPASIISLTRGTIRYRVTQPGRVRLEILDLAGRRLEMPVDRRMDAGEYTSLLHLRAAPAGIYICRLTSRESTAIAPAIIYR